MFRGARLLLMPWDWLWGDVLFHNWDYNFSLPHQFGNFRKTEYATYRRVYSASL